MFDVDNFKFLNDRCGHTFGDVALRHIGPTAIHTRTRLRRALGRRGIRATGNGQRGRGGGRRTRTQTRLQCGDQTVVVTVTGGLTILRPGDSLKTALARANDALLKGKRTGKNRIVVDLGRRRAQ